MRRHLQIALTVAVAASALACGDFSTTVRPTEVTITPSLTTAKVGQQIEFRYSAQGRSMAGLIIDYGDGGLDSIGLGGAVTATGFKNHTYGVPANYLVSARLEDFLQNSASTEVKVNITP
jgi:hypothetical protein